MFFQIIIGVNEWPAVARQIVQDVDLHRRVPAPPSSDELGELTATINQMLERLEQLFTAQRCFVADGGHELRTPLTAIRGHVEALREGVAHDPELRAASLDVIASETARLDSSATVSRASELAIGDTFQDLTDSDLEAMLDEIAKLQAVTPNAIDEDG